MDLSPDFGVGGRTALSSDYRVRSRSIGPPTAGSEAGWLVGAKIQSTLIFFSFSMWQSSSN
jgi:hypothetical protein